MPSYLQIVIKELNSKLIEIVCYHSLSLHMFAILLTFFSSPLKPIDQIPELGLSIYVMTFIMIASTEIFLIFVQIGEKSPLEFGLYEKLSFKLF